MSVNEFKMPKDLLKEVLVNKKLLGLYIMVGKGEEKVLDRCLASVQGPLFDEIVVTQTFEDSNVRAVIDKYEIRREFFAWNDNFSDARNASFSHSNTNYCAWIDADDVIKPDNYKKLLEFKPKIPNYDIVMLDYVYTHDEHDKPVLVLPRERIVKNCPEIKWMDPIHEYMTLNAPQERMIRLKIAIDHYRVAAYNPDRNLKMLKKVYDTGKASQRIKFYYGKELSDNGNVQEALPVLEKYVEEGDDFRDNLTVACIRLSKHYYDNHDFEAAKSYALKGIRFNSIYAENYITVGTIFEQQKNIDEAINYYKEAMTKPLEGGMSQIVDFYGFVPAGKLSLIYYERKDYIEAAKYNEIALTFKPDFPQMLELKKAIAVEQEKARKGSTLKEQDRQSITEYFKTLNFRVSFKEDNIEYADIRLEKIQELNVVWLMPSLDLSNPSIRIRRYNVIEKMKSVGVRCRSITNYYGKSTHEVKSDIGDANVVVFTQFSEFDFNLMKYLKQLGVKTAFDHCEGIFGYQFEDDIMKEADVITCCSTVLAEMTNARGFMNTTVVKDSTEEISLKTEHMYKRDWENMNKLKAGFFGMGGNGWLVSEWLKDEIDEAGYELVLCTEWDNATHRWDLNTWMDVMNDCDVVLCPQRVEVQPAKSNVKVTTAMALGMPVIASPTKAYQEVIKDGENGFIANTKQEWKEALIKLKDPAVRERVGRAAKDSVGAYTLDSITKDWIRTFDDLVAGKMKFNESAKDVEVVKNRDLVDVIIACYNNVEYLKMCVSSIMMNTTHPYHLIISDAGSNAETWGYLKALKGISVLGSPEQRINYSEACNAGIKASQSKYFVILNSDVIVSKGWLTNMVDKMDHTDRLAVCGVLSNCDIGWLINNPRRPDLPTYPMKLEKSGIELHPGMKIETIKPHVEELYSFMDKSNVANAGKYSRQPWVAVYATIFARCAVDEVGFMDPIFRNGCEDLDWCVRLSKFGYVIGQALDAFVFHFGGISRAAYQIEDREQYNKEDSSNHALLYNKWVFKESVPLETPMQELYAKGAPNLLNFEKNIKRVAIWTGPAWEPWNKQKVDEGMAGSETWASYLARSFVKKGFRVTVYNDLLSDNKNDVVLDPVIDDDGKKLGDVRYRDHTYMAEDVKYDIVDYFITSRSMDPLRQNLHSLKNYVMIHDVFILGGQEVDIMSWRIQKYAYLSEWHKEFLQQYHKGMPSDKMFLTANGIDQSLYADVDKYEKKNQTVYSSSLDRGLYQLLLMLPEIRKEVPDFKVIVCYGLLNWEASIKASDDKKSLVLLNKIKELLKQPGVEYLGRVDKKTLSGIQKESKVWLMPEWFAETFCISSIENGAAKNALLSTDFAGLKTTIGDAGILLPHMNLQRDEDYQQEYKDRFIKESIKLLMDESYRKKWADKAYDKVLEYNWDSIADEWVKQFNSK